MLFLSAKLYIQLLSLDKSTGPLIGVSFISHDDESKDVLIWYHMYVYIYIYIYIYKLKNKKK